MYGEIAHLEVGKFVRTSTEVHGGMGFTDLVGLHYWFKRIGFNRQLLGGPEKTVMTLPFCSLQTKTATPESTAAFLIFAVWATCARQ